MSSEDEYPFGEQDDGIVFDTPPSRELEFETPKARMWEHWLESLKDNPRQWAKLPYRRSGTKAQVKGSLRGIPGVELVDEGEELYARYDPSNDSTLSAYIPITQPTPFPPLPAAVPLPRVTAASDAASRIEKIVGRSPGGILEPAITPLSGGLDALLDNPAGPIIGE